MSTPDSPQKVTASSLRKSKGREKIAMLTCYDYPTARLLDESGLRVLLVGDSVGMVVLGFPDTTWVTMEHILHHTSAVARAKPSGLIVADLPYESYTTPDAALRNSQRLVEAGADAVKLEGVFPEQIRAIVSNRIPVMGHLGMLPQSIRQEGGYKIKGKTEETRAKLVEDARVLEESGAFSIVLELVQADTAALITRSIGIPTIGIGSGKQCDGQVLVTHDLIGAFPWFRPKFATARASVAEEIKKAVAAFRADVEVAPDHLV